MRNGPILGYRFIKIFQLNFERTIPLGAQNFGPAMFGVDKYAVR